jgi:capsid protein
VTAWLAAVQAGFASEYEVLRKQGKNPRDVLEQIATWRRQAGEKGLVFNSDAGAVTRLQQAGQAGATNT